MRRYDVDVVGESFQNEDGSSRQEELARLRVGDEVTLERDHHNPYDANCVRVLSARGIQIGNAGREQAKWLSKRIAEGKRVEARIASIGESSSGLLGATLKVSVEIAARGTAEPAPSRSRSAVQHEASVQPKGCMGSLALLLLTAAGGYSFF